MVVDQSKTDWVSGRASGGWSTFCLFSNEPLECSAECLCFSPWEGPGFGFWGAFSDDVFFSMQDRYKLMDECSAEGW
jgi:hypothetical protein